MTTPLSDILDGPEALLQQQLAATAKRPAAYPRIFRPGVHMIVWPRDGWSKIDAARLAADLVALGCVGVIPQASDTAPAWIRANGKALADAGLDIVAGLGRVTPAAIIAGLDEPRCRGVLLDEEDWRNVDDAARLTHDVLSVRPDASPRIADCMYPSVRSTRDGHPTGHDRITRAFNTLCGAERAPQCYLELPAIPDGAVARELAWARDPSQWPAIGVPAERIVPTAQAYKRSATDHVALLLAEPTVILWDLLEMDPSCRVALLIVKALRGHGFTGPGAVEAFRRSAGLATDGLGPLTCAALGVVVPAGVRWHS